MVIRVTVMVIRVTGWSSESLDGHQGHCNGHQGHWTVIRVTVKVTVVVIKSLWLSSGHCGCHQVTVVL